MEKLEKLGDDTEKHCENDCKLDAANGKGQESRCEWTGHSMTSGEKADQLAEGDTHNHTGQVVGQEEHGFGRGLGDGEFNHFISFSI